MGTHEPEHKGSFWLHPYFLYIVFTTVLFIVLALLGWLAWKNGWIPNRGIATGQRTELRLRSV